MHTIYVRVGLVVMGIIMFLCLEESAKNDSGSKWDKALYAFCALLCWGIVIGSYIF